MSLLQAHVLDALLDFFVNGELNPHHEAFTFDFELIKLEKICNVQDTKFVSFLVSVTKRPKDDTPAKLSLKMQAGSESL